MKRVALDRDSSQHPVPAAAVFLLRKQGLRHLTMSKSKKIVIQADLIGKACQRDILSIVAGIEGIKSMDIDYDKCTLTVVGPVDPVRIVQKLKEKKKDKKKKKCVAGFAATIISVEDDKPKEEKDPCKEACEKLCKAKCDKACCKECKEKCEKECKEQCEKKCKEWLEKGSCSCGCAPSPGITYTPCPMPSYPYYCYGSSGWPYGGVYCYEERSPAGQCIIQ